jgi:hypothetical protein
LAAVTLVLSACGGSDEDAGVTAPASDASSSQATSATAGGEQPPVSTVVELTQGHVDGTVDYPQRPPIGGDHNARWQNCGVYRDPIGEENAVHSLEHGAVWVTYRPDLAESEIATLEALADGQTHVLVTPYPDLKRPVVLTAWGAQQGFDSADEPGIADFIRDFQQGPQTPELGAPCIGGIGTPV